MQGGVAQQIREEWRSKSVDDGKLLEQDGSSAGSLEERLWVVQCETWKILLMPQAESAPTAVAKFTKELQRAVRQRLPLKQTLTVRISVVDNGQAWIASNSWLQIDASPLCTATVTLEIVRNIEFLCTMAAPLQIMPLASAIRTVMQSKPYHSLSPQESVLWQAKGIKILSTPVLAKERERRELREIVEKYAEFSERFGKQTCQP